jgi:hypothetical protein
LFENLSGKFYKGKGKVLNRTSSHGTAMFKEWRKVVQNNIEVDAKIKESTGKTEEELDGRNKEGHERKKPKRRPVGR